MSMAWAFGLTFGGMFAGWLAGALYMQWVVKGNAEHAVKQDHRVSLDRKAAIIARIRGCPVEWVLDEFNAEREEPTR